MRIEHLIVGEGFQHYYDFNYEIEEIFKNGETASVVWYRLTLKSNPKMVEEINSKYVSIVSIVNELAENETKDDSKF